MKNLMILFSLLLLFSCKNNENEFKEPENALDAGREFIQLSLQGKFNAANRFMLQDDDNKFWFHRNGIFVVHGISLFDISDVQMTI